MKRGRDYLSKSALLKPRASISNHSLEMSLHTWALFGHRAWAREGQGLRLCTPLSSGSPAAWSGRAPSFPETRPSSKAQVSMSSPCEALAAVYAGIHWSPHLPPSSSLLVSGRFSAKLSEWVKRGATCEAYHIYIKLYHI